MISRDKHDRMANAIRFLSMDAVEKAKSGHPGLPMGAADIATVLFTRFMKHDPKNPNWADRDRFVLSAGHGSMLLYSLLYLLGYEDITIDEIKNFRQLGSRTAGHPEFGHAAGIETTTGPLGQGFANSVGMAIAERVLNARFGNDLVDHYTYALAGDGCLMEGISQEALTLAGHLKLNKLIVLFDDNNISIDGEISLTDSTDQCARFEASGWNTIRCDGHDPEAIAASIEAAKASDKPTLIACRTTIGFGAPTKSGTAKVHGAPLGAEEIAGARKALGWDAEPFTIPSDILDDWRLAGLHSAKDRKAWEDRLAAADAETRGEFERRMRGDLPENFDAAMVEYKEKLAAEPPKVASRKASEMALEAINAVLPETIGGSADLTGSNNTKTSQTGPISADDFSGRYVHYGIREHAMAAAMNGMTLHGGIIPYGGTFMTFSDYARPAMRLASLMQIRSIFVMTHDSIGLGEDGPTHQPVEHLAALRAIPNHFVFRPADAVETAECWQVAVESRKTPSTLALSRQNLTPVRTSHEADNLSARGAYELAGSEDDAKVTLFATGSEVEIAMDAKALLDAAGLPARVVSVPCFELFEQQSEDYRKAVTGNAPVKIAIEAGIRQGWDAIIGSDGVFIGMTGFGASAPAPELYKHFGITAEAAASAAQKRLAELG
ncbi:transketolase [Nitratireductor aquimarinus]|uniref:transketolase n=1 Tax=Nitratireductor TaxID=245876 RepID=UPI0019D3A2A2|nr:MULTISPECIES: transketolase [Nitratireductor]MBN7761082.1 transketolase [Nitratireductor aquibiodomus]MBN7777322.1 transketolase [Nitratireductor pacificus]MBN7780993.1 transketolase [Nitratireductor pacificus]MBN7789799.1 transketolase [Nitratireductor aquimarinus]MBN8244860.1 transketolase [Nitratireductor aquimarinus]